MSRLWLVAAALTCAGLGGCLKPAAPVAAESAHGRYVGVGIYSPQEPWTHIIDQQQAKEGAAARAIDDQAIIVVEDSQTGEVRACGDLTGYCVGMNPWSAPLQPVRRTPIALSQHNLVSDNDRNAATAAKAEPADSAK